MTAFLHGSLYATALSTSDWPSPPPPLGASPFLIDTPTISDSGLSPDKVAGPPGSGIPPDTSLLSLETKQYSLGEGGDVGTGKGGDTGGFNKDFGSTTSGTAWNDAVSVEQSYLPTIEADVNAGNDAAATTTLWDNTSPMFIGAVGANTSDLGQGLIDLGVGSAAAIGAVGGVVRAASDFASGNIGGGILDAAGAVTSANAAYKEFTTPAAQDAIKDILNSINQFLDNYDPSWDYMWGSADAVGVPGAAKVYNYLQSDGRHPAFAAIHPAMYSAANSVADTLFPAHPV